MGQSKSSHDDSHSSGSAGYGLIFGCLVVLTVVTVLVAYVNFDHLLGVTNLNLVVAMFIASIKALLVALFFMHLKHEDWVVWLYAAFPLFLLVVMIAGVFIDNPYRIDPRSPAVIAAAKAAVESSAHTNAGAH